jgi:hypothetical protein
MFRMFLLASIVKFFRLKKNLAALPLHAAVSTFTLAQFIYIPGCVKKCKKEKIKSVGQAHL